MTTDNPETFRPYVATITGAYLRGLLQIAKRAEHDVRYYLRGVYMDPAGYAVATDGHVLLAARVKFARGEGRLTLGSGNDGGFIVPTSVIQTALRSGGRKLVDRWEFQLSARRVEHDNVAYTRAEIAGPETATSFAPIDGTFPGWRQIVPRYTGQAPAPFPVWAAFNPELLCALHGAFHAMGAPRTWSAVPLPSAPDSAAWVPAPHPNILGVVMPLQGPCPVDGAKAGAELAAFLCADQEPQPAGETADAA